jgi:hypothetical protein
LDFAGVFGKISDAKTLIEDLSRVKNIHACTSFFAHDSAHGHGSSLHLLLLIHVTIHMETRMRYCALPSFYDTTAVER